MNTQISPEWRFHNLRIYGWGIFGKQPVSLGLTMFGLTWPFCRAWQGLTETFNRRAHHQCQNLGTLLSMAAADSAVWVPAASGHRLDIIDNRYPVCGRRLDSTWYPVGNSFRYSINLLLWWGRWLLEVRNSYRLQVSFTTTRHSY